MSVPSDSERAKTMAATRTIVATTRLLAIQSRIPRKSNTFGFQSIEVTTCLNDFPVDFSSLGLMYTQIAPAPRISPDTYITSSIPETLIRTGATNACPTAVPSDPNKLNIAATMAIATGVAITATVALIAGDVIVASAATRNARTVKSSTDVPNNVGKTKQSAAWAAYPRIIAFRLVIESTIAPPCVPNVSAA